MNTQGLAGGYFWIITTITLTASPSSAVDSPSSNFTCEVGFFPCGDQRVCKAQKYQCDGTKHCENGADESYEICKNNEGWLKVFLKENDKNMSHVDETCLLHSVPSGCSCKNTRVACEGLHLTSLPPNLTSNVTHLFLQDNQISDLRPGMFGRFSKLKTLQLSNNSISYIPPGTFDGLSQVTKLYLRHNDISKLEPNTFRGLSKLSWLLLQSNNISEIQDGAFADLNSITHLELRNNKLSYGVNDMFFGPNGPLISIDLEGNKIKAIGQYFFPNTTTALVIILTKNEISSVHEDAFHNQKLLIDLDLCENKIREIPEHLFSSNPLQKLCLGFNSISFFQPKTFSYTKELTSLNLTGLTVRDISVKLFQPLEKLKYIYFKAFKYCRYAPHVRHCTPKGDGISSFSNLLDLGVFRCCIWIIAIITCVGNIFVMIVRIVIENENNLHSLFIKNLCAADFMMGVYLFIIASHDVAYRDKYNTFADSWMSSWVCQATGFLAMTSCEVSILILTFMSVERYIVITQMFSMKKLGYKSAIVSLVIIWLAGISIALAPIIFFKSMGEFYGTNGVCFPLHIHEPYLDGWQYSAFVFLGLNFAAMLTVSFSYSGMFWSVMKTRRLASSSVSGDRSFAKRIFLIVLTDAFCWIPVIIVKILTFAQIRISVLAYGWLAIFVLPINSALNPMLYSLTTFSFRRKIRKALSQEKKSASPKRSGRMSWPGITVTLTLHDSGKIIVTRDISREIKTHDRNNCISEV